jgi:hypothetical protein
MNTCALPARDRPGGERRRVVAPQPRRRRGRLAPQIVSTHRQPIGRLCPRSQLQRLPNVWCRGEGAAIALPSRQTGGVPGKRACARGEPTRRRDGPVPSEMGQPPSM